MRDALLDVDGAARVTPLSVVIGLGNPYRRDDGVGPVVAAAIDELALDGVRVLTGIDDPLALLLAWTGAARAVVVDAAITANPVPGRVRCYGVDELAANPRLSSHEVDVAAALALGRVAGRVPDELVLVTVEPRDTGHGVGLSAEVDAAVPLAAAAVVREIVRSTREADPPFR